LDNQKDGLWQLHGSSAGSDGRQDVSVHGDMESRLDYCDRAVEWRVVRVGILGENVIRKNGLTSRHTEHHNRVYRIF